MNFKMPPSLSEYIWFDGELIKWEDAKIHVLTHSLAYSGAVYEGQRAYNSQIFKLEEHSERLLKSAKAMHLDVNWSLDDINEASKLVLQKNNLKDAYVRPLIWRCAESLRMSHNTLTTSFSVIAVPSKREFGADINLMISPWRKISPDSIPSQAKTSAQYAMATVSQELAKSSGYDDALMLDYEGYVAECTVSNIFFARKDHVVTPIADRFLNGITRQSIIKMLKSMGFSVEEKRIDLSDLEEFDCCFTTGTSVEITGVGSIDRGDKKIFFPNDSLIRTLQSSYASLVGKQ